MKFDDVLVTVGEFGWYQRRVYFLLCLPAIMSGAQMFSAVFIMSMPEHRCKLPGYPNDTFQLQDSYHTDLVNWSVPRVHTAPGLPPTLSQCLLYTQPPQPLHLRGRGNGDRSSLPKVSHGAGYSPTMPPRTTDYPNDEGAVSVSPAGEREVFGIRNSSPLNENAVLHSSALVAEGVTAGQRSSKNESGTQQFRAGDSEGPVGETIPIDSGRSVQQCDQWVYDTSEFESSIITEFDVVCDDTILRSIYNSVIFAGALVGSVLMGVIADVFGRKKAIMLSLLIQFSTALAVYLSPNFPFIIAMRSVSGIATHSLFAIGATMGIELVGPSKRTFTGMVVEFFWCGGVLLVLPIAYFSRDWRTTQLALCLLTVPMFALWWLIPESPRWLISEKRYSEAERVLEKICRSNNTKLPPGVLGEETVEKEHQEKLSVLCSHSVMVVRTVVVLVNWFVVNTSYYGLSLNVDNLSGSTYRNYLVGVVMEIVAYAVVFVTLGRVGRRSLHCFCMVAGGVVCLSSLGPSLLGGSEHQWMVNGFALLGRMLFSGAYSTLYILTAELFPTVVRNSAMGVCFVFESLGGMVSPYISDLGLLVSGPTSQCLPLVVFGAISVVAGGLAFILPETLGKALPETVEDAVNFDKPRKQSPTASSFVIPMLESDSSTPLSSSQV